MKTALLIEDGKEGDVVLIMPRAEFLKLHSAVEAAAQAHPRSRVFRNLMKAIEATPAW